ncbi:unnamed protein product, partial [Brachionus calyciflorus]
MALANLSNSIDPLKMSSSLGSTSVLGNKRQKFKLEPLKVLEPSNKKLNLPESQRIMYILERLVKKVEILEYINLIINNEEKIRQLIQLNLTEEEKNKNYEEKFLAMCHNHKYLIDTYNKGQFKSSDSVSSQTKESLESLIKNSCKDLIRVINNKPTFFENIKNELGQSQKPNPQILELKNLMNELKDVLNERLLTTPNEQREKIDYLKELLLREKTNNELIQKLNDELNAAMADKEKEIQVRNDQIRRLDSDLKNVEKFSTDLVKRTKVDAEQQEASEGKASEGRKSKLQQELNQLRQQFQNLVLEHREQEQILRKEKWKHETNVEGLLSRYDDDMTKKQNEIDEIEALYEEEKKQLQELEEKFKPLEEEYLKILDERRTLERIRRMEEDSLNKKVKAAVVIQSYWRGFKLRKGLFKKKGKGKK